MGPVDLDELTNGFAGEIVRPDDPGYDAARAVWNSMIDRRPALIVRPTGTDDVVAALRFAREQELVVAVRCGGHSIPGLSTCDDGIVIDLSRMRGADVDPERRTARVRGGSLLAELDDAAQAHGLVCPVGVVSHTGVAGLTLGGGMGRLQRKLGLTIDSLRAVELVTADGRLVRASEDENPELFWGMRGAGANFGIVTSFEFLLHPFEGQVMHGTVTHPVERAEELAECYRELVEDGPDELWTSFGMAAGGDGRGPTASVSVLHTGSQADAERDLAGLRALGAPLEDSVEPKPYLATQRLFDAPMEWGQRFSMKSSFLAALPTSWCATGPTRSPGCPTESRVASRSGPGVARSGPCPRKTLRSRVATPPTGQAPRSPGTTTRSTRPAAPGHGPRSTRRRRTRPSGAMSTTSPRSDATSRA